MLNMHEIESELRRRRGELTKLIADCLKCADNSQLRPSCERMQEKHGACESWGPNAPESVQLRNLLADVKDIDAALLRLGNGTFGRCTLCGKAIEQQRIISHVTACTCLLCKQGFEQRRGFVHAGI